MCVTDIAPTAAPSGEWRECMVNGGEHPIILDHHDFSHGKMAFFGVYSIFRQGRS